MNYNKIVGATYNWFSLEKLIWFLVFFWLSLPVFLLVPIGLEKNFFLPEKTWFVIILYAILYFGLIVSFLTLTYYCLKNKKFNPKQLTISKFFNSIILVFLQFFYIFIWNINKKYRFTQLLLLFGSPLLWFYSYNLYNLFIEVSFNIFLILYLFFVLYNYIRTSFSLTYFLSNDCTIKHAIKQSWYLTHDKFLKVLFSYILIFISIFAIFIALVLVFGGILSLILLNYLIPSLAYSFAGSIAMIIALAPILIAYYSAYFELYGQLVLQNKASSSIKRILVKKIFAKKQPAEVLLTKKKKVKNKIVKKKKTKRVLKKTVKKKQKKKK